MGYPENILAAGERVVVHHHPHWRMLVGPCTTFLVVTGLAGVGGGYVTASSLNRTLAAILGIGIGGVWAFVALAVFVRPLVRWKSTHFVLTDRRVIYRAGVLTRAGVDIPMRRINSVEFRHGLVDRMLRTGTLIIESASDDPLTLHGIPRVEEIHSLLYHEVYENYYDESIYRAPGEQYR